MAENDSAPEQQGGEPQGSAPSGGDTTLLSRLSGLDAKVSSLTGTIQAKDAEIARLAGEIEQLRTGKVSADEALRAQLAERDKVIAEKDRAIAVAKLQTQFPETFGVFGEAIASMSAEALAAAEARFKGVSSSSGEEEPPTPTAHNEARTTSGKPVGKPQTADDIEALLLAQPSPDWSM